MNHQTNHKVSIAPLRHLSDLRNVGIREANAASMGLSLREYETVLRHIGVDYSKEKTSTIINDA